MVLATAGADAKSGRCLITPHLKKDLVLQRLFSGEGDDSDNSSSSDQTLEQLSVLRRLEATTYKQHDYYATVLQVDSSRDNLDRRALQTQAQPPCSSSRITVSRSAMVEFLYRVSDYGGFERQVVAYAMNNLLDRYFSSTCSRAAHRRSEDCCWDCHLGNTAAHRALLSDSQSYYQLVALTCLYMAVKLLEPANIGVASMVPLTNGLYSVEDFCEMERTILQELKWRVAHGPLGIDFVRIFLQHLPSSVSPSLAAQIFYQTQYQLELAVADYELCCCRNNTAGSGIGGPVSTVAVAALWNALEWTDVQEFSLEDQSLFRATVRRILLETASRCDNAPSSERFIAVKVGAESLYLQQEVDLEDETSQLQPKLAKLVLDAYAANRTVQQTMSGATKANSTGTTTERPVAVEQRHGCGTSSSLHHRHDRYKYRTLPLDPESVRDVTQTDLLMYA